MHLVRSAIQERKPVRPTARRSGWIGCNILLDRLPLDGWIEIIKDGSIRSPGPCAMNGEGSPSSGSPP